MGAAMVAGKVRHEVYGGTPKVASTLIPVATFAGEMLIEIKCVAHCDTDQPNVAVVTFPSSISNCTRSGL